jgi:protein-export membrane protein SecD
MKRNDVLWLIVIILAVVLSGWLVQNPDYPVRLGLDLQGGLQVLLQADLPEEQEVTRDQMDTARQIIGRRVNAIGAAEPLVQVEGDRRILVELPGIDNPQEAIELIQETALLEFVDSGEFSLPEGMCIRTSLNEGPSRCELAADGSQTTEGTAVPPTYETILTGAGLRNAGVESDGLGGYYVTFTLTPEAGEIFGEYTRQNLGRFLTIVLDKEVVSSPSIESVIEESGTITGNFTLEEAQQLATQLRFGSLPIPLRVESTRQVGATLGEQSIAASIRAGVIGVVVVLLFMVIYYRLPGFLADIALLIYALLNIAVFKGLADVLTLTLPAITGFLLSTGMAVDANVLVFERMKEELRKGAGIGEAIDTGFSRAWTSIRDANIATLVICFILWTFGRNLGASAVEGFAVTLAIGVVISMFTAVIITRTLVRLVMGQTAGWIQRQRWLVGA